MNPPLLSLLLAVPAITALLLPFLPASWMRPTTWLASLAGGALALAVVAGFEPRHASFQWVESAAWIPTLGVHYRLGVDGLSVLFLPATELLFAAVLLVDAEPAGQRLRVPLLFVLKTATLGIFCALDGILFFLFWELTLLPLYFLVARCGLGPRAGDAAMQYTLTMLMAGVPLLLAFLVLACGGADAPNFDLREWLARPPGRPTQFLVFILLLAGFAFKIPVFPLHSWLPALAREGPAGMLAIVTGLKVGAYALLRLAIPLAPEAAAALHWLLAGLGCAAMAFGAAAALAQTNLRPLLAYASISHVGLVVLGLASFSVAGVGGAVFQLLNFSLMSTALFLLVGALHRRLGTTEVAQLGGAAAPLPLLAAFFLFFGLASIGLPGTSGFPAELTLLLAVFEHHAGAALAALAAAGVGAAAFLSLYRRAFFGPAIHAAVHEAPDLDRRELFVAATLALIVLVLGFFPALLFDLVAASAQAWAGRIPSP